MGGGKKSEIQYFLFFFISRFWCLSAENESAGKKKHYSGARSGKKLHRILSCSHRQQGAWCSQQLPTSSPCPPPSVGSWSAAVIMASPGRGVTRPMAVAGPHRCQETPGVVLPQEAIEHRLPGGNGGRASGKPNHNTGAR